ncbi:MAG: Baseplate J-like protein [Methanosaeta sp. PtaU1.Bin028]|nr:MAG: Baseplate J-like protein [Methanosaeta sp. PtaU1.Bin028]
MRYFCCDETRKADLKNKTLNGIDFLEVEDDPKSIHHQKMLHLYCIKPIAEPFGKDDFIVEGGERVCNVGIKDASIGSDPRVVDIKLDHQGDLSIYTLRLLSPLDKGFDPQYSSVDFFFSINCPSDFDCLRERICSERPRQGLKIDYLAKDYASFRRLAFDRISALVPDWRERNPSDLGVALVEILAYIGDYLSYRQDAIGTEAYLGTARKRRSIRRHARLVEYYINDGCNSRVWLQFWAKEDAVLAKGTRVLTSIDGTPIPILPGDFKKALEQKPEVFETMHQAELYKAHNEMHFYAWGNSRCCLPRGATRATLLDDENNRLRLRPGDVLIFEERLGPKAWDRGDPISASLLADRAHRHPVRLISVIPEAISDGVSNNRTPGELRKDPLNPDNAIVEIEWHSEDALPFPLCISTTVFPEDVSMALGNIVLADHGLTIEDEVLDKVPASHIEPSVDGDGAPCRDLPSRVVHPRFSPSLNEMPVTNAAPYNERDPPVSCRATTITDPKEALPAIYLTGSDDSSDTWVPARDLLNCRMEKRFVAEMESDGSATLRFGDNIHGRRPDPGTEFLATYRVGNGIRGNVGAETLIHVVTDDVRIQSVRNPMPAVGGTDPEGIEEVRQKAPYAFRTQERAVTQQDYAEVTERFPAVQRAAATFRWTGSWHTVFLTIDREGGAGIDHLFKGSVWSHMQRYRMAGHDIEVDAPIFVPLEVEMYVCVRPDYFRSDVKEALLQAFSSDVLPNGSLGLFHPDNFTFGQPVYLSRIYQVSQSVPGVAWVKVTKFRRAGDIYGDFSSKGILEMERLEIARLDNDPNFPENGIFKLIVEGGK